MGLCVQSRHLEGKKRPLDSCRHLHKAVAVWDSTEHPVALKDLKVIVGHGLLQQFNKSSSGSPMTIQLSVLIYSSLW